MPIPDFIPAAGLTPASAFYPQLVEPLDLPPLFLADAVAPSDIKDEDGEVTVRGGDLYSITEGSDPIDAQVVTAIRASLNSGSALGRTGNRIRSVTKNDGTTASTLKFLVDEALKTLVSNRDIGDVVIEAEADDYLGGFYLQYKNLRTGSKNSVPLNT